jgi:hypothetical protein
MKQGSLAAIELRDLQLKTDIGTYRPNDTRPDVHLLDLTLYIEVNQVVIFRDGMAAHPAIHRMEISLRKSPVRLGSGSLGVRLTLDEISTDALRPNPTRTTA